ncbi:MAG TPA: sensor domain-containing diguanylate cyclase [Thermodesulfobacteriota bacterium]|nr:sensor domain-containing diguanylate cyclase [Thermodesulfobacteriota bacterium]
MTFPSLQEIKERVEILERELSLLRPALEIVPDPVFILDPKGAFLKVNPRGEEMLGYPLKELDQMVFLDLVDFEDFSKVRDELEAMKENSEARLKIRIVNRWGEKIPVEISGRFQGEAFLMVLRDLREAVRYEEAWKEKEKELHEKIRERDQYSRELQAMRDLYKEKLREIEKMREEAVLLSHIDDLTEIYNHRFFIQQLTLELERQKRYPSPLSLLMIDIDYFKHYNDTNGHLAGDQVLKATALLIQHAVRQTDIVARYGGEEFAAILINAGKEKAREIGERVRRGVADTRYPNEHLQPNGNFTVSVGVATYSPPISTLTGLIREADSALYRAKRKGRNRIED